MSRENNFRNSFAENIFYHKYAQGHNDRWYFLCQRLVDDVCGNMGGQRDPLLSKDERDELVELIFQFKWLPGGRYLYYAGRAAHFWNNCYLLRGEEDTREEWGKLCNRASDALMSGGGIGVDYSVFRAEGEQLSRTGGIASGPIPLMDSIDNIGKNVMQGGSRRSALYASLNWQHGDVRSFLRLKNWDEQPIAGARKGNGEPYTHWDAKQDDINHRAPMEFTNISLNYDDGWLADPERHTHPVFLENVRQALRTGEPGFSFNFGPNAEETLRNACTEVTSSDDSDVCNLGSINLARLDSIDDLRDVVHLATKFLLCGTLRADLPYEKVYAVREKNRRLGVGLMGIHEWLLKRGHRYEVVPELHDWLKVYKEESDKTSMSFADWLGVSRPVAKRAVAPTGSIGILAGTTTGIEPLFAVAYKRRYLTDGKKWKYEFVVDSTAEQLIEEGVNPDDIETAIDLSRDPERRIKFQADVQDYVDMSISSTINLPQWGTEVNNEDHIAEFSETLASYAPRLRGFTCYPDGSRGGQPITSMDYTEAMKHKGVVFEENDICDITGRGGTCGA